MSPSRRAERRAAAFLLYQQRPDGRRLRVALRRLRARQRRARHRVRPRARPRARGPTASRLDSSIDAAAEGWSAERMAVLERNILRLAVWELGRGEVPVAVAIDEAVTLAKRYASPEAGDAGERRPRPDRARPGGGTIDQTRLQEVAAELERLARRARGASELDARAGRRAARADHGRSCTRRSTALERAGRERSRTSGGRGLIEPYLDRAADWPGARAGRRDALPARRAAASGSGRGCAWPRRAPAAPIPRARCPPRRPSS